MKKIWKEMKYSLYIMVHPFKGFWDLKHEGEGSFRTSMILLGITVFLQVASALLTEYLFNETKPETYNFLTTVGITLFLFFGWCVANWCFTCLNDGEGTMKDIMTAMGYALAPLIITTLIQIPLSYYMVAQEEGLFRLVQTVGICWTGMLVVFGTLVVHQYSFGKTLIVCLATIIGMMLIVYIGILFLNLITVVVSFVIELMDEIRIASHY